MTDKIFNTLHTIFKVNIMDTYDSLLKDLRKLTDKYDSGKISFEQFQDRRKYIEDQISLFGDDLNIPRYQIHRDIYVATSINGREPPNIGIYRQQPFESEYRKYRKKSKPSVKCSCKKK